MISTVSAEGAAAIAAAAVEGGHSCPVVGITATTRELCARAFFRYNWTKVQCVTRLYRSTLHQKNERSAHMATRPSGDEFLRNLRDSGLLTPGDLESIVPSGLNQP